MEDIIAGGRWIDMDGGRGEGERECMRKRGGGREREGDSGAR